MRGLEILRQRVHQPDPWLLYFLLNKDQEKFPILLEEFSIRKGSAGKGNYTGGNGVKRKIKFLQKMDVSLLTGRRKFSPHGLLGGEPALPGKNILSPKSGNEIELPSTATITVHPEDKLTIETPGGGGWGTPGHQS